MEGRRTGFPIQGGKVIVHEFDFRNEGVIYEEKGVKISSFPAIHILDGSVSFRLDWNGRSFVFGGDSYPNKWFIKHAKGAELVVHECFFTPETLEKILGTPYAQAVFITSYIHTPPSGFGKLMSAVKPRLAVGYHTIRRPELDQLMLEEIRTTYDGPLAIANDLMAWTVTKEAIVQREVVSSERVQPPPTTVGYKEAKRSGEASYSEFIASGKWKEYVPPPLPEPRPASVAAFLFLEPRTRFLLQ